MQKKYTITRSYGKTPISEWLARKVKEYAKEKYGLDLKVEVVKDEKEL